MGHSKEHSFVHVHSNLNCELLGVSVKSELLSPQNPSFKKTHFRKKIRVCTSDVF